MTDTPPHDGSPERDSRLSDPTSTCAACGKTYSGPIHFACLAANSTIRGENADPRPPAAPPRPKGDLDDLPEEAAAYADDESRLLHQYILVKQVGKGGMGTVWKAWDKRLTRWVAIKFLLAEDGGSVVRFWREAKLAARLRHPNIAAIYDVGEAPSKEAGRPLRHYLAMEFIDGKTLADCTLPRTEFLEIFVKIARAVDSANKAGVVHRDLKPANIMVTRERWPYVMDFGVAKAVALDNSQSVSGTVVGTPAYMPPEQAEGRLSAIDARSDVYSLGATMYASLLGRPPFDGESAMEILRKVAGEPLLPPRKIDPSFPADLEALMLKAMAWDRKDRYSSAADLADDIARHLQGEPLDITLPPDPRVVRRKTGKAILVAVAILFLVAAGIMIAPPLRKGPPADAPPRAAASKPMTPVARPPEAPPEPELFTLRIAVHPFAEVVSITRDGEAVALTQSVSPLQIPDLPVGSYELVLRHPRFGDRTVSLPRERLHAKRTVVVWGQMDEPSLEVKDLP
jgi:serine/threonine protein kinase